MPVVTLELAKALTYCNAAVGMPPSALSSCIESQVVTTSGEKQVVTISLSDGAAMRFLVNQGHNKTILTSYDCLISECFGINIESIPEILSKLNQQNVKVNAIQFPLAFMVKGRITGKSYRAHFNHILIYKDAEEKLNARIIDSTLNPIGLHNPIPIIGSLFKTSILSGNELLQSKLATVLLNSASIAALSKICDLPRLAGVIIEDPLLTCLQPSLGDKRCGIYVLNAIAHIINLITSDKAITSNEISKVVHIAHTELNQAAMMAISYQEQRHEFRHLAQ